MKNNHNRVLGNVVGLILSAVVGIGSLFAPDAALAQGAPGCSLVASATSIEAGESVTFTFGCTEGDLEWNNPAGGPAFSDEGGTAVFPTAGSFTYSARGCAGGACSAWQTKTITVSPAPSGSVTSNSPCLLPGATAPDRCDVTISWNLSGRPIGCLWLQSTGQVFACDGATASAVWTNTNVTPLTFVLKGHKDWTEVSTAIGVTLGTTTVVATSPVVKPSCTLSATPNTVTAGQQSTLTLNCSENPTSYEWLNAPSGPAFSGTGGAGTFSTAGSQVYAARGCNAGGCSDQWAGVTVTVNDTPPAVPTSLTATANSSTRVTLTWVDSSNNESGFKIYRSPTSGGGYSHVGNAPANATSYQDNAVSSVQTYYYVVAATNPGGDSANSNEATATTPVGPPAAPTALTVLSQTSGGPCPTAPNCGAINLSWVDNSSDESEFRIYRRLESESTFAHVATVVANKTWHLDSGLVPDTIYRYYVTSYSVNGESSASNQQTAQTDGNLPKPIVIISSPLPNTTFTPPATFHVTGTAEAENPIPGIGSVLIYLNGSNTPLQSVSAGGAHFYNFDFVVSNLGPGTHSIRVRATNANGSMSETVTVVVTDVPPITPTNLVATPQSSSSIQVTWNDNASNEQEFELHRSNSASGPFTLIYRLSTNNTAVTDPSAGDPLLTPNTTYYYRVRATNAAGASNWSNVASATTFNTPGGGPEGLAVTGITASTVNLSWTLPVAGASTKIYRSASANSSVTGALVGTTSSGVTNFTDTGLIAATQYFYTVKAVTAGGDSAPSNEVTATTTASVAGQPTQLTATAVGFTKVKLTWQDNATTEIGFRIERKNGDIVSTNPYRAVGTTAADIEEFTDVGVLPDATYTYRVAAYSATGAVQSDPVSITLGAVPNGTILGRVEGLVTDEFDDTYLIGWTCQKGLTTSLSVDTHAGTPGSGVDLLLRQATSIQRTDVAPACGNSLPGSYYGFKIPLDRESVLRAYAGQPLCVYAVPANLQLAEIDDGCRYFAKRGLEVTITTPPATSQYAAGAAVFVRSTATGAAGNQIDKVEMFRDGVSIGNVQPEGIDALTHSTTWSSAPTGVYRLTAKVTTLSGATATSPEVPIYVGLAAAITKLTKPKALEIFTAPANIALEAKMEGSFGSVTKVDFYVRGRKVASGTYSAGTGIATGTWTGATAGTYILSARAFDNTGSLLSLSTGVTIVVKGALTPIVPPNLNAPDAGSLPGGLAVSPSGAASYSIPIAVPPGTAGIAPALSLNYSSQSGLDLMGVGWSIGGLSEITRCAKSIAIDSMRGKVNLDGNDVLCLDGQRLIAVSGAYWAAGTKYRTEIDTLTRITHSGTGFKVEMKNNQVRYYGTTANSNVLAQGTSTTRVWPLTSVEDRRFNKMTFLYVNNGASAGEYHISQIDYTSGGANSVPYNSVKFDYGTTTTTPREDGQDGYLAGTKTKRSVKLAAIKTYKNNTGTSGGFATGGELVHSYNVAYDTSSQSGLSLVSSVTQCDKNNLCLPATTFTWSKHQIGDNHFGATGSGDWGGPSVTFQEANPSKWGTELFSKVLPGDFNGDGRMDLLSSDESGWKVCLSNGAGFTCQTTWGGPGVGADRVLTGDFNGDGRTDLAHPNTNAPGLNNGTWEVCLSTGSTFSCASGGTADGVALSNYLVGDMDGDGRDDLVMTRQDKLCRLNGAVFACNTDYAGGGGLQAPPDPDMPNIKAFPFSGDFNGSGKQGYLVYNYDPNIQPPVSMNYNFSVPGAAGFVAGEPIDINRKSNFFTNNAIRKSTGGNSMVADINGDGYADLVGEFGSPAPGPGREFCYGTGTGLKCVNIGQGSIFAGWIHIGDVDGDGQADWLGSTGQGTFKVCRFGTAGLTRCSSADWVFPQAQATVNAVSTLTADFNGDGKVDLALYDKNTQSWKVGLAGGPRPDVLLSVTNGVGQTASAVYKTLSDPLAYTRGSAIYPKRDIQDATLVVSQLNQDNGAGSSIGTRYEYENLRTNLEGRGSLGFEFIKTTNLQSGAATRTQSAQDFPYIGMPVSVISTLGTCPFQELTNEFLPKLISNGTQIGYISKSTSKLREALGTACTGTTTEFSKTTTTVALDSYGNPSLVEETAVAGGENYVTTTTTTFNNNTAPASDATSVWFMGQPASITVKKTSPNNSTTGVTRNTTFNYHATWGELLTQTVEPNDATTKYRLVTTYGRNTFGLPTTKTLTWTDPGLTEQTRVVETVSYDARGQFATSTANALNHTETRTYDAGTGARNTLTSPNNKLTTWEIDTFGRVKKETRPDGTDTNTTIKVKQCVELCPPFAVTATITQSSGNAPKVTYADRLGRVLRTQTWSMDGVPIYADVVYDARGRVAQQSRPYFATDEQPVWTTYTYDELDRLKTTTDPDGVGTVAYDGLSTVTTFAALAGTTPSNQRRETVKNALGKVRTVTDVNTKTVTYEYEPFGNLAKTTDPAGNSISIFYDLLGRRIELRDPDLGTTAYYVNALGEVAIETSARGQATYLTYDALGRLTHRAETSLDAYWEYDTYQAGKLTKAYVQLAYPAGARDYERNHYYDSYGRPYLTETRIGYVANQNPEAIFQTTLTYDAQGRNTTSAHLYTKNGNTAGYVSFTNTYNLHGYQTEVTEGTGVRVWQARADDALGHLTQEGFGNGIVTKRVYNAATARIDTVKAGFGEGDEVLNEDYDWDAVGNLTRRQFRGASGGMVSETFGYDGLNRLTASQVTGLTQHAFSYDDLGNLTSKTGPGNYTYLPSVTGCHPGTSGTASRTLPHAVKQVSAQVGVNYSYDCAGNLTGGNGKTYQWTSFNKPIQIYPSAGGPSDTFAYNPERQRARHNVGLTGKKLYYAGAIEAEVDAWYVSNMKVAMPNGAGVVMIDNGVRKFRYTHKDHLGSVVAITDETGQILERSQFDAWGKRRNLDGTDDTANSLNNVTRIDNKGYTGHEQLDGLGLVHMNGRVYDPYIGRFTSADPIMADPGDLQVFNRYSYVENRPMVNVDPSGHAAVVAGDVAFMKMDNFVPNFLFAQCGASSCTVAYDSKLSNATQNQDVTQKDQASGELKAQSQTFLQTTLGNMRNQGGLGPVGAMLIEEGSGILGTLGITRNQGEPYDYAANQIACQTSKCKAEAAIGIMTLPLGAEGGAAKEVKALTKEAAKGLKPFALGLGEYLDDFAKARGASTYKDLADPTKWKSGVLDALADSKRQVHFNLDGVDVWKGVQRASSGRGGATDWELLQIKQSPQFWDSLQFWKSGQQVPNPFK